MLSHHSNITEETLKFNNLFIRNTAISSIAYIRIGLQYNNIILSHVGLWLDLYNATISTEAFKFKL